jgi:hypothetical protein
LKRSRHAVVLPAGAVVATASGLSLFCHGRASARDALAERPRRRAAGHPPGASLCWPYVGQPVDIDKVLTSLPRLSDFHLSGVRELRDFDHVCLFAQARLGNDTAAQEQQDPELVPYFGIKLFAVFAPL